MTFGVTKLESLQMQRNHVTNKPTRSDVRSTQSISDFGVYFDDVL